MKNIYTILLVAFISLFATSCEQGIGTRYAIAIENSVSLSYDEQSVTLKYVLGNAEQVSSVKASTAAAWIKNIDTTEIGKITFEVEANDGDVRQATIKVQAQGHATAEVTVVQITKKESTCTQTLLFYFFGTSLDRYFKTNIQDAAAAIAEGAIGTNNRVLFLIQDEKHEAHYGELCYDPINKKCVERHIEDITLDGALITPEQIGQNIARIAEIAPAERYGIIFAGHGQGWIPREALNDNGGISAFSTSYGMWEQALGAEVTRLGMPETRAFGEKNVQVNITELAQGIDLSGISLDYILFDACFMSNVEAIYDLRNCADYIIASPCEIMGRGFPYHRTLPHLFTDNGATSDLDAAAKSYYSFYKDEYTGNARCGSVALIDCSQLDGLRDAAKELMKTGTIDYDRDNMQTYEGQSYHFFYDISEWADLAGTDKEAQEAFHEQLERTVVAKYTLPTFYSAYGSYGTYTINEEIYSGLTTSAPSYVHTSYWRSSNWYKDVWPLDM